MSGLPQRLEVNAQRLMRCLIGWCSSKRVDDGWWDWMQRSLEWTTSVEKAWSREWNEMPEHTCCKAYGESWVQ